MSINYISHARTSEELKAEVCSDLRRRISFLDGQMQTTAQSQAEKSRIARASSELVQMLDFWHNLEIAKPERKRK